MNVQDVRQNATLQQKSGGGWRTALALALAFVIASSLHAQMGGGGFGGERGGFPNLPHVRGTVTEVKGSDITIQPEQGAPTTVHCSDNTHIYKNRQTIQPSDIHVGDMLMAAGDLDNNAHLMRAVFVGDVDAATVAKMRADLGKTWIAGKVTAIDMDALQLTITRIDHKSQVITVDETTSFKKDRQSVTLRDVHVGDRVRGKGSVKDGVFVPEELMIMDASPGGNRPQSDGQSPMDGPAPAGRQ